MISNSNSNSSLMFINSQEFVSSKTSVVNHNNCPQPSPFLESESMDQFSTLFDLTTGYGKNFVFNEKDRTITIKCD